MTCRRSFGGELPRSSSTGATWDCVPHLPGEFRGTYRIGYVPYPWKNALNHLHNVLYTQNDTYAIYSVTYPYILILTPVMVQNMIPGHGGLNYSQDLYGLVSYLALKQVRGESGLRFIAGP